MTVGTTKQEHKAIIFVAEHFDTVLDDDFSIEFDHCVEVVMDMGFSELEAEKLVEHGLNISRNDREQLING